MRSVAVSVAAESNPAPDVHAESTALDVPRMTEARDSTAIGYLRAFA